jgi:hypothetical protein
VRHRDSPGTAKELHGWHDAIELHRDHLPVPVACPGKATTKNRRGQAIPAIVGFPALIVGMPIQQRRTQEGPLDD